MMGIVDSNYRFMWGTCGFPGNSHNAIIFQATKVWTAIKENDLIPYIGKYVSGVLVPPLVLGDSAFPLQTWLMKHYGNTVLTTKIILFAIL